LKNRGTSTFRAKALRREVSTLYPYQPAAFYIIGTRELKIHQIYDVDVTKMPLLSQFHFTGKRYGLLLVNKASDTRKTK
jgi:hypothetical protein